MFVLMFLVSQILIFDGHLVTTLTMPLDEESLPTEILHSKDLMILFYTRKMKSFTFYLLW